MFNSTLKNVKIPEIKSLKWHLYLHLSQVISINTLKIFVAVVVVVFKDP